MFFKALTLAAAISSVMAQAPNGTSICDYYTTALLKNNTALNQKTVLTLVVNTAVIGNYSKDPKNAVPGILTPGEYNGTKVDLAGYFNGGFASTNRGGSAGVSVNFLDGGGAAPLENNTAASDTTSNQYMLITHLYEYFGTLLGCSMIGTTDYPAYDGDNSMYSVHKFMALSEAEVGYFITQVALSAASFGVAQSDIAKVGAALSSLFGYKCTPEMVIVPTQPAALQAICIGDGCPTVAVNATCSSYAAVMEPAVANATLAGVTSSASSGSPTSTGAGSSATSASASASKTPTTNSAAVKQGSFVAAVAVVAAAFFL